MSSAPWLSRFDIRTQKGGTAPDSPLENHVVVAGYGLNGQTVVQALRELGVPHAALDLNPDTIRGAQARGESAYYGDCTRAEVLRKVGLDVARDFIVAISDPQATRQAVQVARHVNPGLHIIARTKYLTEIEVLGRLGANVVIAEEFETTLEIVARVLHSFNLPRLRIEEIIQHFRGDAYESFRGPSSLPNRDLAGKVIPALQIESITVMEKAPAAGKSLSELNLRSRTGATLLALQRDGKMETIPPADRRLHANDLLVLAGTPRQILNAARLLEVPEQSASDDGDR